MATTEVELFGTDIAFQGDFGVTSTGDLDRIAGLANYREAVMRRILTSPGAIIHRPKYGVGLKNYVNGINSLSRQQNLALKIQEQLLDDPRTEKFLGLRVDSSDASMGLVKITVRVQPVGYSEISVSVSTGGI
jgi:hypothetical protein